MLAHLILAILQRISGESKPSKERIVINQIWDRLDDWESKATEKENREEARKRIISAIHYNAASLDLSKLHLKDLPDIFDNSIFRAHLKTLNLLDNHIDTLPDSIRTLARLKALKVSTSVKYIGISNKVNAALIPSRGEYIEAKLANELWTSEEDLASFQRDCNNEIHGFFRAQTAAGTEIVINKDTRKNAMRALYQP